MWCTTATWLIYKPFPSSAGLNVLVLRLSAYFVLRFLCTNHLQPYGPDCVRISAMLHCHDVRLDILGWRTGRQPPWQDGPGRGCHSSGDAVGAARVHVAWHLAWILWKHISGKRLGCQVLQGLWLAICFGNALGTIICRRHTSLIHWLLPPHALRVCADDRLTGQAGPSRRICLLVFPTHVAHPPELMWRLENRRRCVSAPSPPPVFINAL